MLGKSQLQEKEYHDQLLTDTDAEWEGPGTKYLPFLL